MSKPNNYIYYPFNYLKPYDIKVEGDKTYKMHEVRFNSLYEIYQILKSDPKINTDVFTELSSETGSTDFAGVPYEEAVENLMKNNDEKYYEFVRLQKDLTMAQKKKVHKFVTVRTIGGGQIHIPSYSAGAPLCYETDERISKPKFINIYSNVCYNWTTTKKQVLHKAIILVNVIKALENAHYNVALNMFELSVEERELVYFIIRAKKYGGRVDLEAVYKTSCNVEFLRRILFRVLETTDVKYDWCDGYGSTCDYNFTKKVLNIGSKSLLFPQPREMGIKGNNLLDDFISAIDYLGLKDKIVVDKVIEEFGNETKVLKI